LSVRMKAVLFFGASTIPVLLYYLLMPEIYPRIGLLAGLGVGVVFGSTVPLEALMEARLSRAVRTSLAFALTTGIGYWFYQGEESGIAWAIGGSVGCLCGVLSAQLARDLFGQDAVE